MDIHVDAHEVRKLAVDLGAVAPEVHVKVKGVVLKGALNIQNEARALVPESDRLRGYPHTITFDLINDGMGAEIGPDKDRAQGPLGNILEYGTSEVAPKQHLNPAADIEEPNFEEWVARVASENIL